jgi:predicted RNA-binding protein with PIN domain
VPLARILIDGYSLLHAWPELAEGAPRHGAEARDALIAEITRYADVTGHPVTIVFDGSGAPKGTPKPRSTRQVEVLYSPRGRTADDLIERAAYRLRDYGEVRVVTDDIAERDTVTGFGAIAGSCASFLREIGAASADLDRDVREHNRAELRRFRR